MGRKCSVEGCLSDSNRAEDTGVTFHKVPMHTDVRPRWMSLCHIPEDKKLVKIIYVCSRHFLRADFCNFKGKKYMLRQGVLPSVFPWDKSKLEAIKAEKKEKQSEDLNLSLVKHEAECANIEIKSDMNVETTEVKLELKDELEKTKLGLQTNGASISFTINTRIEALDFNNEWYPARIVEVDYEENEVLIHFEKFSSKYDEWICMNSSRLRPLQAIFKKGNGTEQYEVGERCLAAWSDNRKFPATVTKIMDNDTYEVLFDDGFVKTVKAQRMSKLEVEVNKPGQSSPLFDPIKSSKQDRRDKKRKLNVAALFRKRHKRDSSDEKPAKKHIQPTQENIQQEVKTIEEEEDIQNWRPRWIKSKPVGIEALLETADGPRHTTIVPDPRLPPGWAKHLLRKAQGKWDTIIVSPDNKKFRSKTDIRAYLELHPIEGVNDSMFSFALVGGKRQRKSQGLTPAKKTTPVVTPKKATVDFQESSHNESQILEEQAKVAEVELKEQDNLNSLKILFENDAFKCPIEGCGKTFRRENLAQMHVKHYHPEYTKFLDSTPNVADLAYARTVGENLDKSPGPSKTPALKPLIRTSTPKISKSSQSPIHDTTDSKPVVKVHSPTPAKTKDAEIIKLLSTKPFDKKDSEPIQPLPSGLPTSMYPDIKLKDLLNKAEGMPKRDDLNLKTLCMTRPPAGIKTLLPVVRQPPSDTSTVIPPSSTTFETSRHSSSYKRKRGFSENPDTTKGKDRSSTNLLEPNQSQLTPKQQTPLPSHHKTLIPLSASLPPQPPPQLVEGATSNVPSLPPNNIIIEGGEVIKIVRMKQEEIINCTCGYTEEDGLMIQCELCLCWQHAYCNNIERESQVPEKYVCYICQNPVRERASRKYYHDQDWLRQGALPTGTYHCRDDEALQKRFEKLKTCHDLSGALLELRQYMHSLAVKLKIAEAKNHPKLYLWSKPWEKNQLPEKPKQEKTEIKPKAEPEECFVKNEENIDKEEKQESDSMLMMILKAGKEVMPKLDLNTLMADNNEPIIPRPEAAIDSADCKLNLLEHIVHQESLVDQRLDDFEKQIEALEEGLNIETEPDYPRTRHTVQLLMRDLDKLRDFSYSTTI